MWQPHIKVNTQKRETGFESWWTLLSCLWRPPSVPECLAVFFLMCLSVLFRCLMCFPQLLSQNRLQVAIKTVSLSWYPLHGGAQFKKAPLQETPRGLDGHRKQFVIPLVPLQHATNTQLCETCDDKGFVS